MTRPGDLNPRTLRILAAVCGGCAFIGVALIVLGVLRWPPPDSPPEWFASMTWIIVFASIAGTVMSTSRLASIQRQAQEAQDSLAAKPVHED